MEEEVKELLEGFFKSKGEDILIDTTLFKIGSGHGMKIIITENDPYYMDKALEQLKDFEYVKEMKEHPYK